MGMRPMLVKLTISMSQVCSLRSCSQGSAGEDRAGAQEPGWGHWRPVKDDTFPPAIATQPCSVGSVTPLHR